MSALRRSPLSRRGRRARREQAALEAFRREVQERDGGACQRCLRTGVVLISHHMRQTFKGGKPEVKHNPAIGVALCIPCHNEIHRGSPDCGDWLIR